MGRLIGDSPQCLGNDGPPQLPSEKRKERKRQKEGARSSGSQSANLATICPPPHCQLTPATPYQDSAALFSPYTVHSPDLHLLLFTLLSIPQLSSSFSETSLDMMPRDWSRHSQSQKPGHINQHRSVGRLRVRSMHHPSTGCTLGFTGTPAPGPVV
ncbi:hypothetical protein PAMA_000390 [Pampus argenteus]